MTVRLVVQLAVPNVDPHGWDGAVWDTDVWGVDTGYTDVSCDVQGVSLSGGRSSPLDRYRPQTGSVRLDNRAGNYDAWSELTPWAPPGVRHLGAGTRIRVGVDVGAAATVWLFTGKADYWHHRSEGDDYVEVGLLDDLADLSMANTPEQAAQGAGEHAGARISRILGAHIYQGPTALDPGVPPLQATTLAADALSLLYLTVDSDGGWLWIDGAGTLTFYDADRETDFARWKTPRLVIADDDSGDICAVIAPELDDDRDAVRNLIDIAAAGGAAHIAQDATSQARYGIRTMQRHDLIHGDESWSQALANRVLARVAAGGTRPTGAELWLLEDGPAARVAALQPRDRVRLVEHHAGDVFAVDCYLDAWRHDLAPTGADRACVWRAALSLSPVAEFVPAGRWDTGLWDTDVWGF